jgi:hypothetical protein
MEKAPVAEEIIEVVAEVATTEIMVVVAAEEM